MKKIIFLFLLSFVFLISCGGGDDSSAPQNFNSDSEKEQEQDDPQKDEDKNEEGDTEEAEDTEDTEEETETDEDTAPEEEPDLPDEDQNTPQADPIGNFNINFSGKINTSVGTNPGGNGMANFSYNGMPNTFAEINLPIVGSICPLAMANGANSIVVWLNSLTAAEALSATEKQVFGIALPKSTGIGSGNMKDINAYAFYGEITVNATAGQFDIKCVRAVSDSGQYDITSNDGTNITFTANGDLFDPSIAGNLIPYPACTE